MQSEVVALLMIGGLRSSASPPCGIGDAFRGTALTPPSLPPDHTLQPLSNMSRRVLSLPLRTRYVQPTWTCRRCLTIEADTTGAPPPPFESHGETYEPLLPSIRKDIGRSPFDNLELRRPAERKPRTGPVLPHRIPPQYLQHCDDQYLNKAEREERAQLTVHKDIRGVVVSAGLMDKTVRVRVPGRTWNRKIGKVRDACN